MESGLHDAGGIPIERSGVRPKLSRFLAGSRLFAFLRATIVKNLWMAFQKMPLVRELLNNLNYVSMTLENPFNWRKT